MALSKTALSSSLQTKIQAISGISITQSAELVAFCDAIADAIVSHITTSAVVQISNLPGTVTSGAGAGGTTTSSGTGSIS